MLKRMQREMAADRVSAAEMLDFRERERVFEGFLCQINSEML